MQSEQRLGRLEASAQLAAAPLQAGIQSQALASAGVGAINVVGTVIAGSLVDKAGRKQLLIASYLGMAASMVAMAAGLAMPQLAVRRERSHSPIYCRL